MRYADGRKRWCVECRRREVSMSSTRSVRLRLCRVCYAALTASEETGPFVCVCDEPDPVAPNDECRGCRRPWYTADYVEAMRRGAS